MENRIRIIRAELRMSQRRAAKLAGIDASRFWRIENDYTEPNENERQSVCRALGRCDDQAWMLEPSAMSA